MEPSRPGTGELMAGAGGFLLLLVMFLPWFGIDASFVLPNSDRTITIAERSLNAWQSFAAIDLLLAATGGLALSLIAAPARVRPSLSLIVVAAAALSALAIVLRLIDPPDLPVPAAEDTVFEVGRRLGAFFSLLCTAAIALGGNRAAAAAAAPSASTEAAPSPEPAAAVPPPAPRPAPAPRASPALEEWSRADIDAECGRAWRSYDRRLDAHYARYFEAHPELAGGQRFSARDIGAALPPGWEELARGVPDDAWERRHLSGKSSQTLAVGLLGVGARRDPSLAWLFDALGIPGTDVPRLEFEHTVTPGLLGERPRQTSIDVLVEDPRAVICIEAKWREPGIDACACRGAGVGPLDARCSARVEQRDAYWSAAGELFGLPERADGAPCPISPSYEAIRHAAAACALAGGDRPGVLGLIYDADNPYFAGCGGWPGWPEVLREAVASMGDTRGGRFQFTAISWQELMPGLPLDDATGAWAREKHSLG